VSAAAAADYELEEPGQAAAAAEQAGNLATLKVDWQEVAAPAVAVDILHVAEEAGTLPSQVWEQAVVQGRG
jgi:hypothetical protein